MKALKDFLLAQASACQHLAAAIDQGAFAAVVPASQITPQVQAALVVAPVAPVVTQSFQPQVTPAAAPIQASPPPAAPPGERLVIPAADAIRTAEWKKDRILQLIAQEGWAAAVMQKCGVADLDGIKVVPLKEAVQAIIQSLGGGVAIPANPPAPAQAFQPQVTPVQSFQPQVTPQVQSFTPQVVSPPGAPQVFTPPVQAPPPPPSYPLVEQFKARLQQELAVTGGVAFNSWTSQEHYNMATALQGNLAAPLAQARQVQPGQQGYEQFQGLLAYFNKLGCQANCVTCPRGPGQTWYCHGVFDNEYPGAGQFQFGAATLGVFAVAPENIGVTPPCPVRLVETPRC